MCKIFRIIVSRFIKCPIITATIENISVGFFLGGGNFSHIIEDFLESF